MKADLAVMDVLEAIRERRAVRSYTQASVPNAVILDLLDAAVQAPSAINSQPWAFAVIRGRARLQSYSERAKVHMLAILPQSIALHRRSDTLASADYNVFHGAGTLVVICAKPSAHHSAEDCCLAAQNFMLAAHAAGLGTCPVGFVRPWLDLPEIKSELGISQRLSVVMPITVGWPAEKTVAPPRREPDIACWHNASAADHDSA